MQIISNQTLCMKFQNLFNMLSAENLAQSAKH